MLGRLVPATTLALVVSEAILILTAFVIAAYSLVWIDPLLWLLYEDGLLRVAIVAAIILFSLHMQDLYSRFRVTGRTLLLQQICLALGIAFLAQAVLSYTAPGLQLPRWIMMVGCLILLVVLPAWRILYSSMVTEGLAAERILFVGASPIARKIAARIREHPELGLAVSGFVADADETEGLDEAEILGPVSEFSAIFSRTKPGRVVVGMTERRQRMPVDELLDVNFSGTPVEDAANTHEVVFGRVSAERLRPSQLIFSRELGPRPTVLHVQAVYSFAIALVGLAAAAPVMLIVGVLVRLTSPGPALYRQTRVGMNGVVFTVLKFRSMRQDAEVLTGAVWATKGDPRITPLGRFLRRSRLDELPQLINVLRGEMSIVGPRPERPEFVAELSEQIPFYRQRHAVKPGITGWAQINHKYGDSLEDTITKLEYDLYYLKNLTPALDFYIMFQTVKIMLLWRGAQ